jgi:hypothetical protein
MEVNKMEFYKLKIAVEHMNLLDDEEYSMARREYLGASDASSLLGVNPFQNWDTLMRNKKSTTYTKAEQQISKKVNVRKGKDLESLILQKFEDRKMVEVVKPKHMYKFKDYPFLAVNFDGIITESKIPVEAKFVSQYGEKYWDKTVFEDVIADTPVNRMHEDISEHIKAMARMCGIPAYYYTQVQQQIFALNVPYGYIGALFDKNWEYHIYRINKDIHTITAILAAAQRFWDEKGED